MLALWAKAGAIKPSKKAKTNAALRMINSSPLFVLGAQRQVRLRRDAAELI
jgi:hypothetical protein